MGYNTWFWILGRIIDADDQDKRAEMVQKINFLLHGEADYVKEANEKIEKLEQEIQHLRYDLERKQDKPRECSDHFDDEFGHLG